MELPAIETRIWRESLAGALQRLSAAPAEQIEYITALGTAPLLDELALEFDDFYRPLVPELGGLPDGGILAPECAAINTALGSPTLGWQLGDLTSAEWSAIRERAARASELLLAVSGVSE